jgi:PPOX class probable FMN-dependent enzyme
VYAEGSLSIFRIVMQQVTNTIATLLVVPAVFHSVVQSKQKDSIIMPQFATTESELETIYGARATAVATVKEIDYISDHYRLFIDASPFVFVATAGPEGLDCTPRGDPAGFVCVVDRHTVMLPDRRGNNRIDTLRNLVRDPRISLLFLVPGIGRTLRINGRAVIRIDAELCDMFKIDGKAPRSVIGITAERVYTQCPRALIRSHLWDPTRGPHLR